MEPTQNHNSQREWARSLTRRSALRGLAGFLAGSPCLPGQQDTFRDHSRVPGLEELVTAFDFEPVAYAKLPRDAYDYTAQGVDGEFTLRRNREAFDWVSIVPRGLVNASSVLRTETELLGTRLPFPILIAPSAGQGQLHPQGELAMYQGGTAAQTPMIVSNNSSFPMDKIASAAKGLLWFQLYPRQQVDVSQEIVETAQNAGAKAIVVTVDQQSAYYERQLHNRRLATAASASRRTSMRGQPRGSTNPYRIADTRLWYDWAFIDSIRPFVKVPLWIKGIVTPEDAKLCVEHGIDGILVSNHGGRSLDYGPATLEVLPEIVDIVGGRAPIVVDSGFRRGSDIFKALAIGAKAVCLGRVPRWGLGAFGAQGVQRILEILQQELTATMAQAGQPDVAKLDRRAIRMEFP